MPKHILVTTHSGTYKLLNKINPNNTMERVRASDESVLETTSKDISVNSEVSLIDAHPLDWIPHMGPLIVYPMREKEFKSVPLQAVYSLTIAAYEAAWISANWLGPITEYAILEKVLG